MLVYWVLFNNSFTAIRQLSLAIRAWSGRLTVVAENGQTVLATLGAGSVFGEISVLNIAGM